MAIGINVTGMTVRFETQDDIIAFLDSTVKGPAKALGVDLRYKKGKLSGKDDSVTMTKVASVRPA